LGALLCCGAGHVDVASVTAEGSTVELAELEKREKRGKSKSPIELERCRVLGVEVKTVDDDIAALILGNTATTEQRRAAAVNLFNDHKWQAIAEVRRCQALGILLAGLGFGPVQTPYNIVHGCSCHFK
jgi:hypothetical protein